MLEIDRLTEVAARRLAHDLAARGPAAAAEIFGEELRRLEAAARRGAPLERRVLVAGGSGYVGSVLIGALLARGWRVRCLDNLCFGTGGAVAPFLNNPAFSFIEGDIRSEPALVEALRGVTDVVLLASLVGDPISRTYPQLTRDVNLAGSINVWRAARRAGVGKLVFTSTCSNYGIVPGGAVADEETELNPKSVYAETKVAFERHLLQNPDETASPIILRLATAFGLSPRMRFDLTVSEFTREVALGRPLRVYDEDTWRPYCHLDDIAAAIVAVLEAPEAKVRGEVFNVGGEAGNFTKRMIAEALLTAFPAAEVEYGVGGGDPRDYRVSFAKIARALDFAPRQTVPGAIAALAHAIRCGLYDDVESRANYYGNRHVAEAAVAFEGVAA